METLPKDVAIEMALNLSAPDFISFCSASKAQNRVCNSNDFWRRKLERDYPEELLESYQTGEPIANPREVYINKFTFVSRKIENFVEEFIENLFGETLSKFLTKEYRKELYLRLYRMYETLKRDNIDHNLIDEMIYGNLEILTPRASIMNAQESLDLESIVHPFIEYLIALESVNQTKKKLIQEYKKQK